MRLQKNRVALKATKDSVRRVKEMIFDNAEDYLVRAQEAANSFDNHGRKEGIKQFIDDKTYQEARARWVGPHSFLPEQTVRPWMCEYKRSLRPAAFGLWHYRRESGASAS